MPDSTAASPASRCDLVMKGGIASGIVYPLAIAELARKYCFVNIGGTSAGAIAAAATAAAECGRRNGRSWEETFGRLEALPTELGEKPATGQSKLRSLFQPQPAVADVFAPLAAVLDTPAPDGDPTARPGGRRLALAFVASALSRYRGWAAAGALPGALLLADAAFGSRRGGARATAGRGVELLMGLGATVAGAPLAALGGWGTQARRQVPENLFGLCAGHAEQSREGEPEHLTDWLGALLDELAGTDGPLTFGDLEAVEEAEQIRLRMVTTNLTLGRPMNLPRDDDDEPGAPGPDPEEPPSQRVPQWWFDPAGMRRLFPEPVVVAMESAPGVVRRCGLVSLPAWEHLPVIVATRMSLSFPLLLSAVPLHPTALEGDGPATQPMWFSDGGICSNFPIHFFDSPLPRRPTFGVNLRPITSETGEPEIVWRPEDDQERDRGNDAATPWFTFWRSGEQERSLLGFVGAIKDTMQSWRDSVQLEMPGFRDRVVHVGLRPDEGGLNLAMGPEVVARVAERGRRAGETLVTGFADGNYWDEHRWTRYRLFFAAAEELLALVDRGYTGPDEQGPANGDAARLSYPELAARAPGTPPVTRYDWPEPRTELLARRAAALTELARAWGVQAEFAAGKPVPPPQLKLSPRL